MLRFLGKRRGSRLALVFLASVASSAGYVQNARAQQAAPAPEPGGWHPSRGGVELALRAGPSFVAGEAEKGYGMRDQLGVPLGLAIDLGYRVNERFYIGGLWALGVGFVRPEPCTPSYRCPGPALLSDVGVAGRYHLAPSPQSRVDPWLGAGVMLAIEGSNDKRTQYATSGTGSSICVFNCTGGSGQTEYDRSTTRFGVDGLVEAGVDYRLSRRVALGLSVSAFFGKYVHATVQEKADNTASGSSSRGVSGDMHLWVFPAAHFVVDFEAPVKRVPPATPPGQPGQPGQPGDPTQNPQSPPSQPPPDPNEITI